MAIRPGAKICNNILETIGNTPLVRINRITRGTLALTKAELDSRELVAHGVEIARPAMDAARHQLRVSLPDSPLPVTGDEDRLVQVLANVLNNASRYTPPNGSISVRMDEEDGEVVIRVRDNGRGIEARNLERIFNLFDQGGVPPPGFGLLPPPPPPPPPQADKKANRTTSACTRQAERNRVMVEKSGKVVFFIPPLPPLLSVAYVRHRGGRLSRSIGAPCRHFGNGQRPYIAGNGRYKGQYKFRFL